MVRDYFFRAKRAGMGDHFYSEEDFQDARNAVVDLILNDPKYLIEHQVDSFDSFLSSMLPNVIEQFNPIQLNYEWVSEQQLVRLKRESPLFKEDESDERMLKLHDWMESTDLDGNKFLRDDIYAPWVKKELQSRGDDRSRNSTGNSKGKPERRIINIAALQQSKLTSTASSLQQQQQQQQHKEQQDRRATMSLPEILTFEQWCAEHLENKTIRLQKGIHRYDLEICLYFSQIKPPSVIENDGTTKKMHINEARQRSLTYASQVMITLKFRTTERYGPMLQQWKRSDWVVVNDIMWGYVPIMVKSSSCISQQMSHLSPSAYEECPYDIGGYFVINGTEKVIVSQERPADNTIIVVKNNKGSSYLFTCEIKSTPRNKVMTPKTNQVKMCAKTTLSGYNIKISMPHIRDDIPLCVLFKALGYVRDQDIVELILFQIPESEWTPYTQLLWAAFEEASLIETQTQAKLFLCKYVTAMGYNRDAPEKDRRMLYLNDILVNDLLPHLGDDIRVKAMFLGMMTKRLLDVFLRRRAPDNDMRDNYMNKRMDVAGVLCTNLARHGHTLLTKELKLHANREFTWGMWRSSHDFSTIINPCNITKLVKSTTITTGLKYAFSTGNFGLKENSGKHGVAQVLGRLTPNSTISHLRRTNMPLDHRTSKVTGPRHVTSTQYFVKCPAETPEGHLVGASTHLAMTAGITMFTSTTPAINVLDGLTTIGLVELVEPKLAGTSLNNRYVRKTCIFINGNWKYTTSFPSETLVRLKESRRMGHIHIKTSISWNITDNIIMIQTDAGRLTRPLFKVNYRTQQLQFSPEIYRVLKQRSSRGGDETETETETENESSIVTLHHLCTSALSDSQTSLVCLEYIDSHEVENCVIAMKYSDLLGTARATTKFYAKYTHCEIDPALMMGAVASIIPLFNHNQSPRNTYESAMGKQAMAIYALNFLYRMDTVSYVLRNPQRPLIFSRIESYLPGHALPSGVNAIVAIMSGTGYNQEDSVKANLDSIDRGFLVVDVRHCLKSEEKKRITRVKQPEQLMQPPAGTQGMHGKDYTKLLPNGRPIVNEFYGVGDAIIGKVHATTAKTVSSQATYRCCSTIIQPGEEGVVDRVTVSRNCDGYLFIRVRIRSARYPIVGDKVASRHGQKGTIGMTYRQQDMPMTRFGIQPNIIMNPHAIPSRMTVAHVLECFVGKASLSLSRFGDATAFSKLSVPQIGQILQDQGYQSRGDEVLYNGTTGEQMMVDIFFGPTYYQRLKHMVEDKQHARATGPNVILTRQPVEGRRREGGLRIGEMERDCILSHGLSQFLKETYLDRSDNFRIYTCRFCGLIAAVNPSPPKEALACSGMTSVAVCKGCDNYTQFAELRIPYAMKLLIQELESLCIAPRIFTRPYVY
jgi:DNA-directed RNA polymerase II subunit RPB2